MEGTNPNPTYLNAKVGLRIELLRFCEILVSLTEVNFLKALITKIILIK